MSETMRSRARTEPGSAGVRLVPNWTEQEDPVGVNWTMRNSPSTRSASNLHPSLS
jgi:hypothetical protein